MADKYDACYDLNPDTNPTLQEIVPEDVQLRKPLIHNVMIKAAL